MPFETLDFADIKLSADVMACAESTKGCLKFCVVFLNIPIILIGLGSLGAGIWILEDDASFFNMAVDVLDLRVLGDDLLHQAAVVMVTAGAAMIFISGIGAVGALSHSPCLLGFYAMTMVLLLALQVAAVVLGVAFKSEWEGKTSDAMKDKVRDQYGGRLEEDRERFTKLFDTFQEAFGCCGWEAPLREYDRVDRIHWDNTYEDGGMMVVPASCCTRGGAHNDTQRSCTMHPLNSTHYNSLPCGDAVHDKFTEYQWVVVGTASAIIGFQFIMIALTIGSMPHTGETKYDMS